MRPFLLPSAVTLIAGTLAAVLLAGCAFGTRHPTLTYPPVAESGTVPSAQTAARPVAKNVRIVLDPFTDQRSDKSVVGTVRNGFGMRTADVVPTNSVSGWVMQAITMELEKNGYAVVAGRSVAGDHAGTTAEVSGEILNVFCDMYFSYTGQVSLLARVRTGGKELLNRHFTGEGSAGIAWGATEESFAQSLGLALAAALRQFVAELDRIFASP